MDQINNQSVSSVYKNCALVFAAILIVMVFSYLTGCDASTEHKKDAIIKTYQ